MAGDGGLRRPLSHDRSHLPGRQPADPTTVLGRASTSACCRSSASAARSTGASSRTTPPGQRLDPPTAASSARSATTPRATSSTRSTRRSRTGNPVSPGSPSTSTSRSTVARTPARPVRRARRVRARARRLVAQGNLLNTYVTETWSGRPTASRATATATPSPPGRPAGPARRCSGEAACLEAPLMGVQFGPVSDRPGHARGELRRASTATTASPTAASTAPLDKTIRPPDVQTGTFDTVPAPGDYLVDVEIADGQPRRHDLQGDPGRGHQHRQRRRVRPAGPAAGVRRRAAPGRRCHSAPTDIGEAISDGSERRPG